MVSVGRKDRRTGIKRRMKKEKEGRRYRIGKEERHPLPGKNVDTG